MSELIYTRLIRTMQALPEEKNPCIIRDFGIMLTGVGWIGRNKLGGWRERENVRVKERRQSCGET